MSRIGFRTSQSNSAASHPAARATSASLLRIETFNDALLSQCATGVVEEVWFKGAAAVEGAGPDDVQMWLTYPPGFDPKKRYPLLHNIHGGPHTAFGDSWLVGACALIGAGITAFYMTRLMLMTFFGTERWEKDVHPHESPLVMTIPLMVLGVLSAVGGALLFGNWIVKWLDPVVGVHAEEHLPMPAIVISLIALLLVLVGVGIAWLMYGREQIPNVAPTDVSPFTKAARAELYGNELNDVLAVTPGRELSTGLALFDRTVVDGAAEGTGTAFAGSGHAFRRLQNGFVRSYALILLGGAFLVLGALLVVNL